MTVFQQVNLQRSVLSDVIMIHLNQILFDCETFMLKCQPNNYRVCTDTGSCTWHVGLLGSDTRSWVCKGQHRWLGGVVVRTLDSWSRGRMFDSCRGIIRATTWASCSHLMCLCSPSSITWYLARAFMLMRRNVAAGIGSNEQGEYCRAALQRSDRKEPRYKWPTLLYWHTGSYTWLMGQLGSGTRSWVRMSTDMF